MRRGATLVELVVAIVIGAIVFGSATLSVLRQQQTNTRTRVLTDADAQLSASIRVLGAQLGAIDRGGDLVAGEARDTALQLRAPIAFSVACASTKTAVTLATDTSAVGLTGMTSQPKAGDSLWWRTDSSWSGALVTAVTRASGSCAPPLTALAADFRLDTSQPDTIPLGRPLRVTRQTRYSLYRASDGTWQFGFRESSGIPARFAASQPVVGPLVPHAGLRHTGFRYFDDTGVELLPGGAGIATSDVARIRITAHSLLAAHSPGQDSLRTDSVDVALQHARGP